MKKTNFDFDLIVLGSGAGGSAAANIACKNGLKVAIVESDIFGGESPNYGDIPRKAMLNAAHTFFLARRASKFGVLQWLFHPCQILQRVAAEVCGNRPVEPLPQRKRPAVFRVFTLLPTLQTGDRGQRAFGQRQNLKRSIVLRRP